MYEEMVKNAYEEILGFSKEAGLKDVAGKAWDGVKGYGKILSGANVRKAKEALEDIREIDSMAVNRHGKDKAEEIFHLKARERPYETKLRNARLSRGAAIAVPALAAVGATAYGIHRHNLAKNRNEQAAAEKAAVYYDEAQYVKEAAEADYAEACAYEDAAIQILDELGYLD